MSTTKQYKELIENGESIQLVSQVLTEISSTKLKKIRFNVEQNTLFFNELTKVYKMVQFVAKEKNLTLVNKPKNLVIILITSNSRLFGNLNQQLIDYYINQTRNLQTDRIIIGKTGGHFFNTSNYIKTFKNVNFNNDLPSDDELKQLVGEIAPYKRILVFYSKFKTVLTQIPTFSDVTAIPENTSEFSVDVKYIFEPEISKILQFFEDQITTLLIEDTFLQSELARVAARVVSMDQAQINAEEFIKEQKINLSSTRRSINNLRLIESLIAQIKGGNLYAG